MTTTTKKQSFFRVMLDEKDLLEDTIHVTHNGFPYDFEVTRILELIEMTTKHEQKIIEVTFRKLDFANADFKHYLKHLALCFLKNSN